MGLLFDATIALFAASSAVLSTIVLSNLIFILDAHYLQLNLVVNLSQKQIWHNYQQMMTYLTKPWISQLKMDNFYSSAAGLEHFREVRILFIVTVAFWILSGVIICWWLKKQQLRTLLAFHRTFLVGLNLAVVISAFCALIDFDGIFVIFHKLLFRNNDWLFDPNQDPVINILPDTFFAHCFLCAFVIFELIFIILWLYSKKKQAFK